MDDETLNKFGKATRIMRNVKELESNLTRGIISDFSFKNIGIAHHKMNEIERIRFEIEENKIYFEQINSI